MEHNILYQNQFGLRKNKSTVYALDQITEMIEVSIDNRKFGCGIFVDLRKAFDTVNHEILLIKLEHGIRNSMLKWFQSYLFDRKQFVTFNSVSSELLVKINKKALNEKEYIKYLCVIIDSLLSWKHHIVSLSKKISRAIGIMYKLRPFLPLKCYEKCLL